MISVAEAYERLVAGLVPLESEKILLSQALGRVLANDAVSRLTYPPSDVSSMDGYAVAAVDTQEAPVSLRQVGLSQAGKGFVGALKSAETVRIFTGAPMPEGTDAVVIQENVVAQDNLITVSDSVAPGTFVRPRGLDIVEGICLKTKGCLLTARDLGLLATGNVAEVTAYRKPRVGFLATGDELVMPGETIGPDQIISSNSVAMDGFIRAFGGVPVSLGIARDNPESLKQALQGLDQCDLLVTMGGASVGDFDLVKSVMGEEGFDLDFYKVAMRPGKPLIFGHIQGIPLLGLPGNPVSVSVTALLFLRPAIAMMQGVNVAEQVPLVPAVMGGTHLSANDQRQDYMRAHLIRDERGNLTALPFDRQDSSMMSALAASDGLIVRPPHAPPVSEGEAVSVIEFSGLVSGY